jgi:ABC-type phosphate transport system substrate-binding protein
MKQTMPLVRSVGIGVIVLALASSAGAIAADVVAVVSSRSPVTALSANQVADIFLGKANRFPDGGQAVPIDQAEGSAARDAFYARVTGKSAAQMKAHWSKIIFTGRGQPPRQVANSLEARKRVAGDPKAIGYIESDLVDGSVKVLLSP